MPAKEDKKRFAILVAGGIGVAPLFAVADFLARSSKLIAHRKKIRVFIGAKTKSHILCEKELEKLGCKVHVSTEDGTKGSKGLITETMKSVLDAIRHPLNAKIYACGPVGMLKAVSAMAKRYGMECQVSMEERMACGVGVCLGCPVKVKGLGIRGLPAGRQGKGLEHEYKMVCKDGPVFDAKEIDW
jgi:dihydroorotate dehydrogenase electron transfer subunit